MWNILGSIRSHCETNPRTMLRYNRMIVCHSILMRNQKYWIKRFIQNSIYCLGISRLGMKDGRLFSECTSLQSDQLVSSGENIHWTNESLDVTTWIEYVFVIRLEHQSNCNPRYWSTQLPFARPFPKDSWIMVTLPETIIRFCIFLVIARPTMAWCWTAIALNWSFAHISLKFNTNWQSGTEMRKQFIRFARFIAETQWQICKQTVAALRYSIRCSKREVSGSVLVHNKLSRQSSCQCTQHNRQFFLFFFSLLELCVLSTAIHMRTQSAKHIQYTLLIDSFDFTIHNLPNAIYLQNLMAKLSFKLPDARVCDVHTKTKTIFLLILFHSMYCHEYIQRTACFSL